MILAFLLAASMRMKGDALLRNIARIAPDARGRVGAAVMVLESGQHAEFHGGESFPMQSVYKMPIGMAILHEVDRGALSLDQRIRITKADLVPHLHSPIRDRYPNGTVLPLREVLRFTIVESDGSGSDILLRLAGGPARVTAYLRGLGVNGIIVATSEEAMTHGPEVQYRNSSTPAAMVDLLRLLYQGHGLSPASRALLLRFMTETPIGPKRIRGLLPDGVVVAHKTGTSDTFRGLTRATNDAGIVTLQDGRHLAIAVFVSDSRADETTREAIIARIARAAWNWSVGSK